MRKIGAWLVVLVLGWGLKFGWNLVTAESIEISDDPAEWVADENEWVNEELAAGRAAAARGWLDQPDHGTFEADPQQLRDLIASFHAAGAEQVWMIGVEELGRHQLADTIAVELPVAGYARDRIFEIEAELWGGEGTPDLGQRYITVSLD